MIMREFKDVMLISPSEIKGIENVNYNVDDNEIGYAIRNAQDIYLQEIIGKPLLEKLQMLVYNAVKGEPDNIDEPENADYAILLDEYVGNYLAAATTVELLMPLSLKIRNFGVSQNSDSNINASYTNDIKYLINYYNVRAKLYATRLSRFLCNHKELFPELESNGCCGETGMIGQKFQPTNLYLGTKRRRCCK